MSILWVIGALALVTLMAGWQGVRDRYDQARRCIEPEYPRYGATNLETLKWMFGRGDLAERNKSCDKKPAERRPRRAF